MILSVDGQFRLAAKVKVTGDVYVRAGVQAVIVHEAAFEC